MKFKQKKTILILILMLSLFIVACSRDNRQLQVFSIPLSNGEVSIKNFNIISSEKQIYIEDNYYLLFQDENIKHINIFIYDNDDQLVYSFVQNVEFSKINDKIVENTGFVIDSTKFRNGNEIKIEVKYIYSDETEKSFISKIKLEQDNN